MPVLSDPCLAPSRVNDAFYPSQPVGSRSQIEVMLEVGQPGPVAVASQARLSLPVTRTRRRDIVERVIAMPRSIHIAAYVLVLIAVVVSVDLMFFRNRFWERLMANVGIVLVFAAFYLRFLNNRELSSAVVVGATPPTAAPAFG